MKTKSINKLPGVFAPYHGMQNRPKIFKRVVVEDGTVVADLGRKRWTIIPTSISDAADILGAVGGYCRTAIDVAYPLATLGFWKREDAAAFVRWYHEESDAVEKKRAISEALRIVGDAGYRVVAP
jgi:hypothetical protein